MKKIILSIMVVGALLATSCKEEKKEVKDTVNEVTTEVEKEVVKKAEIVETKLEESKKEVSNMVESALEGVSIPNFSNAAVTENLKEYAAYAKDYLAANGNVVKITAMASKGATLLAKGKELAAGLDTTEITKYKSVLSAIQSKMAPSK